MRRPVLLATAAALLCAATTTATTTAATVPPSARAGAQPRDSAHRPVPLRVATYNIAAGKGADGAFDLTRTAEAIRALGADVVGLQEVDVHWGARSEWRDEAGELARMLGMRMYFAPIYTLEPPEPGAPPRQFGVAILSRHRILHAENHDITRLSTQDPNPVPAPAPGFPEVILNVRGALVHVYATHLDYRGDPAVRTLQVADTRRIMAEDCTGTDDGDSDGTAPGAAPGARKRCPPQVLVGDFNAAPDAPELAPLWNELEDTWTAAGNGTDPGHTYPAAAPDRRIDYVTVSKGVHVTGAVVGGTLASDHRPVVTDLRVRRGPHPGGHRAR